MCGRFALTASPDEIAEILALLELDGFPPRYNIAPTQPILIVKAGERAGNRSGRVAALVRWGLVPSWVKDLKAFPLLFNARADSVADKAAFRAAMKYRRCLVPASGFYEWRRVGKAKPKPFYLKPRDARPFAFAGLWESWQSPEGSELDSAAIVTTDANATLAPIHSRMPVVIQPESYERWLDTRAYPAADVLDLLVPANDTFFEAIPVSDKVNKVANMGSDLQTPLNPDEAPPEPLAAAPDAASDVAPAQRELF
ncbi:SOS response-associated peptidase [Aurantimonas sp. MSK8Z-1]|uniref:SOS response-associated peptidase n=1 Tax=Mangrovibrevibacter kandeliae TaxID=2968473 RepID=UPI0021177BE0|nr:SOS response-associated peptidase [Aurantimonas sp. MSK8Z-1]MCW4113935.1 SOS response-associated peptidase [Aurantimonas sp. MSK8Z-1]